MNTDGGWVLQEAFPPPFLAFEGEVLKMLDVTSTYRLDDTQLAFLDADQVLARFAAEYPR